MTLLFTVVYQKQLVLSFMLQTLFGKHAPSSKKSAKTAHAVEKIGQILFYNVATDPQVKHKPVVKHFTTKKSCFWQLTINACYSPGD